MKQGGERKVRQTGIADKREEGRVHVVIKGDNCVQKVRGKSDDA